MPSITDSWGRLATLTRPNSDRAENYRNQPLFKDTGTLSAQISEDSYRHYNRDDHWQNSPASMTVVDSPARASGAMSTPNRARGTGDSSASAKIKQFWLLKDPRYLEVTILEHSSGRFRKVGKAKVKSVSVESTITVDANEILRHRRTQEPKDQSISAFEALSPFAEIFEQSYNSIREHRIKGLSALEIAIPNDEKTAISRTSGVITVNRSVEHAGYFTGLDYFDVGFRDICGRCIDPQMSVTGNEVLGATLVLSDFDTV
ncbi:uncharacterized protein I303_105449 [Kwoniella dejecticola CBS 10117]|uniref:Uncharacterized protein n=1 Tax=Kwoniella dejecticola CBS 10117 TaxID=1296121 RepID=A0A1A6A2H1_9TREE|nr:uncharacterized protein I303_05110 [Kwoniella dejecticola CBS 10117]OBR84253.1 hypothetical protein I303_05110 [Kwoniella dejecticola CBS 10117]